MCARDVACVCACVRVWALGSEGRDAEASRQPTRTAGQRTAHASGAYGGPFVRLGGGREGNSGDTLGWLRRHLQDFDIVQLLPAAATPRLRLTRHALAFWPTL
jgi:hypothetical protein